jgi:hypothetical protein
MRVALGYNKLESSEVKSLEVGLVHGEHQNDFPAIHRNSKTSPIFDLSSFWSFSEDTKISIQLEIDRHIILQKCKIREEEGLRVVLSAYCGQSKYRIHESKEVEGSAESTVSISVTLPKLTCSNQVDVCLTICNGDVVEKDKVAGRPQISFSSIYDFKFKLNLSGQWSQLDVTSVPFADLHLPASGLWMINLKNLEDISPETLIALDASNVISVLLNSSCSDELATSKFSQTALWAAIGFAGIEKFMSLESSLRKKFLTVICNQELSSKSSGDFVTWLRLQFMQGFETLDQGLIVYEWEHNRNMVAARLQSSKGLSIAKASSHEPGVRIR